MTQTDWVSLFVVIIAIIGGALFATIGWILRKLNMHDSALAVLVQQVNPPGDKSLRDLLYELKIQVAERR